jgi:hypothetical protein
MNKDMVAMETVAGSNERRICHLAKSFSGLNRRTFSSQCPGVFHMPSEVYRERTSAKHIAVALGVFVLGIALNWLSEAYLQNYPIWKTVTIGIASVLITTVAIEVLWELLLKRAFVEEILDVADIASEVREANVIEITTEHMTKIKWSKYINNSKELTIFTHGDKTWQNTFYNNIKELMKRPNSKINLILPDPSRQEVVSVLAKRLECDRETVIKNINDLETSFKKLEREVCGKRKPLKVWHLEEAPLITFYRLDDTYVLITYRHNGSEGKIPSIVCHKGGSIAAFVDEQFEAMTGKNGSARQVYPPSTVASIDKDNTDRLSSEPAPHPTPDGAVSPEPLSPQPPPPPLKATDPKTHAGGTDATAVDSGG